MGWFFSLMCSTVPVLGAVEHIQLPTNLWRNSLLLYITRLFKTCSTLFRWFYYNKLKAQIQYAVQCQTKE